MNRKEYAVSIAWEREQAETTSSDKCDFNTVFCCCARQLGRMQVICKRRDGSPLIIIGPHWPFCVFITIPLIIALSAFILYLFAFGNLVSSMICRYILFLVYLYIMLTYTKFLATFKNQSNPLGSWFSLIGSCSLIAQC